LNFEPVKSKTRPPFYDTTGTPCPLYRTANPVSLSSRAGNAASFFQFRTVNPSSALPPQSGKHFFSDNKKTGNPPSPLQSRKSYSPFPIEQETMLFSLLQSKSFPSYLKS
jgi:hypothetical protein